jgi:YVTN family beta-propeller protein
MKSLLPFIPMLLLAPAAGADCAQVFVSNEMSGDVSIIDTTRLAVVATVAVGKRPRGIKLSSDGALVYVALSGSAAGGPGVDESRLPRADKSADGIGVLDVSTRHLVRVIRGVSDPEQLAVSADGRTLFVASEDEGVVVVLEAHSGAVLARVPVGAESEGVNLSPDGKFVYVTSEAEHRVTVIDAHRFTTLARMEVGLRPRSTAFSQDGARAYVMNEASASVSAIDARAHRPIGMLKPAAPAVLPMSGAVSPDGMVLYLTTGRAGVLLAIATDDGALRGSLKVGARPWGLAMSHDGTRLYTANGPSHDISVVDARAWKVLASLPVGKKPWGVACAPEAR